MSQSPVAGHADKIQTRDWHVSASALDACFKCYFGDVHGGRGIYAASRDESETCYNFELYRLAEMFLLCRGGVLV